MPKGETDAGLHEVDLGRHRRSLDDGIARRVHDIGVVAGAAREDVDPGIAAEHVGQPIAGAVDVAAAGEGQVLQVGAQREADRSEHRVDHAGHRGKFAYRVARIVHHIGVGARASDQRVGAGPAVEHVRRGIAGDDIVEPVARAVDGGGSRQRKVFKVGPQRVADRGLHRVGAFIQVLGDDIARVVQHVGVVAEASGHDIGSGAPVQPVVGRVAGEAVVARPADRILDGDAVGDGRARIQAMIDHEAGRQFDGDGGFQGRGVEGVDAASIPDGAHHAVVQQAVGVVPRVVRHVRAVDALDGEDVQRHRRDLVAVGIRGRTREGVVVAHHGVETVVERANAEFRECRPEVAAVVEGVLEPQRMPDLVQPDRKPRASRREIVQFRREDIEEDVAFGMRVTESAHAEAQQQRVRISRVGEHPDGRSAGIHGSQVCADGDREVGGGQRVIRGAGHALELDVRHGRPGGESPVDGNGLRVAPGSQERIGMQRISEEARPREYP